jgi:hypothetical protein
MGLSPFALPTDTENGTVPPIVRQSRKKRPKTNSHTSEVRETSGSLPTLGSTCSLRARDPAKP